MSEEANPVYDIVIVGGGASGLSAAIYATRRELKTLVISQDVGGQAATTPDIENYPGVGLINGLALMNSFKDQAEKFGAEFKFETVKQVTKTENGNFIVHTNTFSVETQTVILAFGLSHKHLDIPGEEDFQGNGVTYCATCDGSLYKGKNVVVVGGGSSATETVIYLSDIAKHVTLINRSDAFRAEPILLDKIKAKSNVDVILDATPKEIRGETCVTAFIVTDNKTQKDLSVACDGVFVEIGFTVKADWTQGLVATDERKQIKITPKCETNVPGIFASGDVTTIAFKQVVISAGEGAKASLQAYQYLLGKSGKRGAFIDWGAKKIKQ